MAEYNANNERTKREYFSFLKEAKGQSEATVDAAAKAIARFESDTKYRDFRSFRPQQAVAFKRRLADKTSEVTGDKLSKATLNSTLAQLKRFFEWLAAQPGFRSKITYTDAAFFNLSEKEVRVATAHRERPFPTLEQMMHVLRTMPVASAIERRNRALVAFTLLTGARDSAIASMKLKHVDIEDSLVRQDARDVRTKFSKTFRTYFFPVGDAVRDIVVSWIRELRGEMLYGETDPLFPATAIVVGANGSFTADGLTKGHWSTAAPIREIFRKACTVAGLPYFNPHSLRRTLVQLGESRCQTPEDFKAWSQNLGHEGVMTTFRSYGDVSERRQADIIRALSNGRPSAETSAEEVAKAVVRELRKEGANSLSVSD